MQYPAIAEVNQADDVQLKIWMDIFEISLTIRLEKMIRGYHFKQRTLEEDEIEQLIYKRWESGSFNRMYPPGWRP